MNLSNKLWFSQTKPIIGALLLVLCSASLASADFRLETERVVIFKDGYGLVIRKCTAKTDANGEFVTSDVPDAAVLGSFWTIASKGTLRSTTAAWAEVKANKDVKVDCLQTIEIVRANLGKKCSIETNDGKTFEGTLLKTLAKTQRVTLDEGAAASMGVSDSATPSLSSSRSRSHTIERMQGESFIVQTNTGDMMLRASDVRRIWVQEMKTQLMTSIETTAREKQLKFRFEEKNAEVAIHVMYFRPGLRWIPTYRIDLTDEIVAGKQSGGIARQKRVARVMLQGELLNEAEDLTETPIDVVVGVPNFRFRSLPSPMILEATLQNVLAQVAPQISNNGYALNSNMPNDFRNSLYSQRAGEFQSRRASGQEGIDVDLPDDMSGQGGNDLYVYSLPKMSLGRGERATVPIMETTAAYRDVYTWNVDLVHSESYAATASQANSPLVLAQNKVWRQVELINDTKLPWTTGPAMLVDGVQPLAQELLTYTSPGGICRVPVTVSVDLRGKAQDQETDRTLKALRWRGHDYAKASGEIEIELANNKTVPVYVEVKLQFGGRAVKVNEDGKITFDSYRAADWKDNRGDVINNSSQVFWSTTIEPEECFKPLTQYEFFIRY